MNVFVVTLNLDNKGTYIGTWKRLENIFTTYKKAKEYLDKNTDSVFPLVIRKIEVDKVQ